MVYFRFISFVNPLITNNTYLVILDEREAVQKKTFTKWVNSHLQRVKAHVNDLYHDLQDGRKLIMLLEILSGERLVSAPLSYYVTVPLSKIKTSLFWHLFSSAYAAFFSPTCSVGR